MNRFSFCLFRLSVIVLAGAGLSACETIDHLAQIGQAPTLSPIQNPVTQAGYRPVQLPMPAPASTQHEANSLFRSGSHAFFKDQRAHKVGDILTVTVNFTDKAQIQNQTKRAQANDQQFGATNFFGLENTLKGADISNLLNTKSTADTTGTGSINRSEQLTTNVAAVVSQVLPNGNLVIEGKQEIRVNAEIRELVVAGVVRPEDIGSDNTIDSAKIAEARIAYGGRGQISNLQQPRYGQQLFDVLLPF